MIFSSSFCRRLHSKRRWFHCARLTCQAQVILWSGTIFNTRRIGSWHLVFCIYVYDTIGTMLVDDDSLLQQQIALIGISQTTVKKIILSLFFPAISVGVYIYAFRRNIRTGVLLALLDWFFHRWCNKLWATCRFFTFSIRSVPES